MPALMAASRKGATGTRRLLTVQIERLWGAGEIGLVRANYAPDIVDHMPVPGQAPGLDGMEQVVREFRTAMPDLRMTLHGTIVDGEDGCDFWTLTGTNTGPLFGRPPTGARVEMSGIDMVRARDGQVVELWHVEEMLRLEAQLGGSGEAFDLPPGYADSSSGPDGLDWLRQAAPDLRVGMDAHLIESGLAARRWTIGGTHTGGPLLGVQPKGRPFRVNGMDVVHIREDGLIDRILHVEELAQLRAQIA